MGKLNYSDLVVQFDDSKSIFIRFDKMFDRPQLYNIGNYPLKRRSYQSINKSGYITDTIIRIFSDNEDRAVIPWLAITEKIRNLSKDYSKEDFLKDIIKIILNDNVVRTIKNFIDNNYEKCLDDKSKEVSNINRELQFCDSHVISLYETAEAIRYVIPLAGLYADRRNVSADDLNEFLYFIFKGVLERFQEPNTNLLRKIHRFIFSRVVSTKYSDRRIWNLMASISKNVETVTYEFLIDIIIGILPKTMTDKNIVNLFHVVIRSKIQFEFSKNHKIVYKPLNLNQVDSEGLTIFDKWEISQTKRDESLLMINTLSIKFEINKLLQKYDIQISEDEFNYYSNRISINKFQINILFLFFSKNLGYYNCMNCSREQYVTLLIILMKYLEKNNFGILSRFIIAIPDKNSERRITKTNKIFDKISNSKVYKDLIKNKYNFIKENIESNDLIVRNIGNLSVSKYYELPKFKSNKKYDCESLNEENLKELEVDLGQMAKEYIDFIKMI